MLALQKTNGKQYVSAVKGFTIMPKDIQLARRIRGERA
jgi:histone H3/H4